MYDNRQLQIFGSFIRECVFQLAMNIILCFNERLPPSPRSYYLTFRECQSGVEYAVLSNNVYKFLFYILVWEKIVCMTINYSILFLRQTKNSHPKKFHIIDLLKVRLFYFFKIFLKSFK